ncbi:hypothetical protein M885DRAFT_579136 [Pelagophyceae sp. CCMP2097]|nr:hypothetical protein M885DRAFT_579136 [Pelagophyceae sp. CCMP2097]
MKVLLSLALFVGATGLAPRRAPAAAPRIRAAPRDDTPVVLGRIFVAAAAAAWLAEPSLAAAADEVVRAPFEPRGITAVDTAVFFIGVAPFAWAAVEFWRRIAVGEPFGTGSDSVVFDVAVNGDDDLVGGADDDQLRRFGGRRILGQDAIVTAKVLMVAAAASIALTFVAAAQL